MDDERDNDTVPLPNVNSAILEKVIYGAPTTKGKMKQEQAVVNNENIRYKKYNT